VCQLLRLVRCFDEFEDSAGFTTPCTPVNADEDFVFAATVSRNISTLLYINARMLEFKT
jgi:hypothetical protein